MGYENDIVTAVAERLAAEDIADWDPTGAYLANTGKPAIFIQAYPDIARPIISLSPYLVAAVLDPNDSVLGLQVRTRTEGRDPRPVNDLDSSIFRALHGQRGIALAGYRITKILFQSGASMGQDGSDRWGRSANFYITGPRA